MKRAYINDHLRQEFSERVSRKRSLLLYPRLSEALKLFEIQVSPQEEQAETELADKDSVPLVGLGTSGDALMVFLKKVYAEKSVSFRGAMLEALPPPTPVEKTESSK